MARNVGDRYACEKCGAVLVYEKACPCSESTPHSHSEICCGQQMEAESKEAPATKTLAGVRPNGRHPLSHGARHSVRRPCVPKILVALAGESHHPQNFYPIEGLNEHVISSEIQDLGPSETPSVMESRIVACISGSLYKDIPHRPGVQK